MKIFLRTITLEDGPQIVKWRNDPQVISHSMSKQEITLESNKHFFYENVVTGKYKQFIVECIDDSAGVAIYPIASVYLKDMDFTNKRCELCIFTSTDSDWTPESQSIAIKLLINKAFNEYDMHKIYTYVFDKYQDEVSLLKSAGFSAEAILKDEAINEKGGYDDVVRLSIFKF